MSDIRVICLCVDFFPVIATEDQSWCNVDLLSLHGENPLDGPLDGPALSTCKPQLCHDEEAAASGAAVVLCTE
jgi:hypothetical protein